MSLAAVIITPTTMTKNNTVEIVTVILATHLGGCTEQNASLPSHYSPRIGNETGHFFERKL